MAKSVLPASVVLFVDHFRWAVDFGEGAEETELLPVLAVFLPPPVLAANADIHLPHRHVPVIVALPFRHEPAGVGIPCQLAATQWASRFVIAPPAGNARAAALDTLEWPPYTRRPLAVAS